MYGLALDHPVATPKLVPDRTLLLQHNPPLSIVFANRAILGISTHSQVVTSGTLLREHLPTPIFLVRRTQAEFLSWELLPQPFGQVLSEATGIDKAFSNLRRAEAIRLEQYVETCHADA
jgi:hypothetical protein